jgi:hypothetical protein
MSLCDAPHRCCVNFCADVEQESDQAARRFLPLLAATGRPLPPPPRTVVGPPLSRIETMPTRTRTYHLRGGTPSSLGTPYVAFRGNEKQCGGRRPERQSPGCATGRQGDRSMGSGALDEEVIVHSTDGKGSTGLTTARGDAAACDLLRIQEELVRTQIAPGRRAAASDRPARGALVVREDAP